MKKLYLLLCVMLIVSFSSVSANEGVLAELDGLPFDEFVEESYIQMLIRSPESITDLGINEMVGMGNDTLDDVSDAYIRETQQLEIGILELLHGYDYGSLTDDQQLTYDIYDWYLSDLVAGHQFMYHNYPVTHFITSVISGTSFLFTDLHPITNKQDAEDYITRLSLVDEKFEQVIEGLEIRTEMGVIPPTYIIQWTGQNMYSQIQNGPRRTEFYTVFRDKVNELDNLTDEEKTTLLAAVETAIDESVIPAYVSILEYLETLVPLSNNDLGAWKLPDGGEYYAYMLSSLTTTDMTADEIHELGLQEVERVQAEIYAVFADLGYAENISLNQGFSRAAAASGTVRGQAIYTTYEAIIADASDRLGAAFDVTPQADVVVIPDAGGGGYYSRPTLDGSRPGAFYAALAGSQQKYNMASLAYHEAIPGHHFQIALGQESDIPLFRKNLFSPAYIEGWALYAERLAYELGFYEDDPYGNLGRLQFELLRAVRLVADTGIHAKGWTFDEAVKYIAVNTGYSQSSAQYRASRYTVWPAQATTYMIGMLKILELRQMAMDELSDQFDIKEFHNVVLTSGAVPLHILERIVQDYIDEKLSS